MPGQPAAYLRTKIPDFGDFDSSMLLMLRGGTLTSMGSFLDISSQQVLEGIILAGGWGGPDQPA